MAWAPDGRFIAGTVITPQGNRGAVYSCAANRLDVWSKGVGTYLQGTTWLPDSRRILGWDSERNSAVLWDTETGTSREIPGLPGPAEFQLTRDGRTLLMNHFIQEGDIWMLTLR